MEQIILSCKNAAEYPKNLVHSNTYEFVSNAYFDKLNECELELFNSKEKAALNFWEFGDAAKGTFLLQFRSARF